MSGLHLDDATGGFNSVPGCHIEEAHGNVNGFDSLLPVAEPSNHAHTNALTWRSPALLITFANVMQNRDFRPHIELACSPDDRLPALRSVRFVPLVALALSAAACHSPTTATNPIAPRGDPVDVGDGWPLSTLAEQGFEPARVSALADRLAAGQFGLVDSLSIARNGRLCFDAYFSGSSTAIHELQSVTKSVTSALVGAAIARGIIGDVRQPVVSVLSDYAAAAQADAPKAAVTIEHLLTMTAGLDWDESLPITDPRNTLAQMNASDDWTAFVVARRVVEAPGRRFVYNSGGVILLGAIVRERTGQDLVAFASDVLFGPLGIRDFSWARNRVRPEQVHTGGGLSLRARDQAKFGQIYLDDGKWNGRLVLPVDWVHASVRPSVVASDGSQYGWLWWLPSIPNAAGVAEAWGARGQHIFAVPALRLVVVVNARDNTIDRGRQILGEIIASITSR
jgi:CubicO group peptidase (beta-lactamase class C family)